MAGYNDRHMLGCVIAFTLALLDSRFCLGQANTEDDLFELSPFMVKADKDIGYMSISTLAGSRLRMEFRDVAASIDIMTEEFLNDVGAVLADEAFIYSAHLENVWETGQDATNGPGAGSSDLRIQNGARSQGMSPPTRSKNYFRTLLQQDLFNSERITIARGPQAVLFGIGSPSGIININLKNARFGDNSFRIASRFDNWGSQRWEIDLNQELIHDSLAVRLSLLDDNQRFWLEPGRDNRNRWHGTFTCKPLKPLTVRIHRESLDRQASVPGTQLPWDSVSYFHEGNGGQLVDRVDNSNKFWLASGYLGPVLRLNSEGETSPLFTQIVKHPFALRTGEIIETVSNPGNPNYDPENSFFDPNWTPVDATNFRRSLTSDDYYPVFDNYLLGDLQATRQTGNSTTAFAELRIFTEAGIFSNFFLEAGYNMEELDQVRGGVFGGVDYTLFVDPARLLSNGELNPNGGRQFLLTGGGLIVGSHEWEEEARIMSSVEMDLRDKNRLLGWHRFGFLTSRQESELNIQRTYRFIGNIGGVIGGESPEGFLGVPMVDSGGLWGNFGSGRMLWMQIFLDQDAGHIYPSSDMIPWGDALDTWHVPTGEGSFGIYGFDKDGPGMRQRANSILQHNDSWGLSWQGQFDVGNIASLVTLLGFREDKMKIKEKKSPQTMINSFGETLHIRDDTSFEETGLFAHYDLLEWENLWNTLGRYSNNTLSAVLHLDRLMDRSFNGKFRSSFHYNRSTNNEGFSKRRDASGEFHIGQQGIGENFGIRLELARSRYVFTLNHWKTDLIGADGGGTNKQALLQVYHLEDRWMTIEPDTVAVVAASTGGYIRDPNGVDFANNGYGGFGLFTDQAARGWTFDFVANPLPGLRVRANLSKTESVLSNIGMDWRNWIRNVRQPLWADDIQWWDDSDGDGIYRPVLVWDPYGKDTDGNGIADTEEDGDGVNYLTLGDPDNPDDLAEILSGWDHIAMNNTLNNKQTIRDFYINVVESANLLQFEGREGLSDPALRKWRFNFTTTYTFQEGLLDNFSIGMSARFRDRQFIGAESRMAEFTLWDGSIITVATEDPSKPLYGEDVWFFDAMAGYQGTIKSGSRRLGYSVQLNVRNVFNKSGIYVTDATASGTPVRVAQHIPREVFFSVSVEY